MDRLLHLPLLFLLAGAAAATAQETQQTVPAEAGRKKPPINPNNPGGPPKSHTSHTYDPESYVMEMLREEAEVIRKGGTDIEIGVNPGPSTVLPSAIPGDDLWSGLFQVTRLDNPFITEQCRLEASRTAQHAIGDVEKALSHAESHQEEWKEVLRGDRRISLSEYMDHVLDCKEFCAPLISSLLKCHIEGIQARHPSAMIFTFEVGMPRPHEEFEFSAMEKTQIASFVRDMRDQRKKILIEARASILNDNERLRDNLQLSDRRGSLMRSALIDAGFPAERILVKSLGWEPPRLAIDEVAAAYGFASVRGRLQNPQYMDQSVVILGY